RKEGEEIDQAQEAQDQEAGQPEAGAARRHAIGLRAQGRSEDPPRRRAREGSLLALPAPRGWAPARRRGRVGPARGGGGRGGRRGALERLVELRGLLAQQESPEPAPVEAQPLQAPRGRAAARQLVVLAREAHHRRLLPLPLEGAEHGLALPDRRAPVVLAVDDEERRGDARRERRGRALGVLGWVIDRRLAESRF